MSNQPKEEKFIRGLFSSYYQSCEISVPSIDRREFGFGGWEKKIEFRHIWAKSKEDLRLKLVSESPLYVSYSVAYYEFPDARPMTRKNWLGADLVFDLDAQAHACGKFTCQQCLDKVKSEAMQLVSDFLISDFGFSQSDISINFSGSRGYHVHVRCEDAFSLDRDARREIADYITGTGLEFSQMFWQEGKKLFGPKPSDGGYKGKFARAFLSKMDDSEFAASLSRKLKDPQEKAKLKAAIEAGNWDNIGIANREKKLREKFEQMKLTLAGRIDSNVTAETSKLIRMPGSLHGGSGLSAKPVPISSLPSFEPMRDAQVFTEGMLKIRAAEPIPAIPHLIPQPIAAGEEVELPMAAAVYLICKKAAALA
jgi:DNA primase small subunit